MAITNYDVFQQLQGWIGHAVTKYPTALDSVKPSKRQCTELTGLAPRLPNPLVSLYTLPSSWEDHELRAQIQYNSDSDSDSEDEESSNEQDELVEDDDSDDNSVPEVIEVTPAPSKKTSGTRLYSLSGKPLRLRLDLPVNNPDPRLAPKAVKTKRPRDESPPIKVEKGTEAPKVGSEPFFLLPNTALTFCF